MHFMNFFFFFKYVCVCVRERQISHKIRIRNMVLLSQWNSLTQTGRGRQSYHLGQHRGHMDINNHQCKTLILQMEDIVAQRG